MDISQHRRSRLDPVIRGVGSGSTLFALSTGISIVKGNSKNKADTTETGKRLIHGNRNGRSHGIKGFIELQL